MRSMECLAYQRNIEQSECVDLPTRKQNRSITTITSGGPGRYSTNVL